VKLRICLAAMMLCNVTAGAVHVEVEHLPHGAVNADTPYERVPAPNPDNAARKASIAIVDGRRASNSGPPDRLVDGRMPANEDAPAQSLKFDDGTLEGRVRLDLGSVISIAQINSYSWHRDKRAPQVYKVYGSDGTAKGFDPAPKIGTDPATCGWTKIALVDSRPHQGPPGGRYAVSISDTSGSLGNLRYLLFLMFPAQTDDISGHTFYGEINVIERK
jgi:hypothetical protein